MKTLRNLLILSVVAILVPTGAAWAQFSHFIPVTPVKRPGPGDPNCAKPVYPKAAIRNEEQGRVVMAYLIDKDGAILDSKIVISSRSWDLDKEALYGIAKCQFKLPPDATEPQWMQMTYVWTLK